MSISGEGETAVVASGKPQFYTPVDLADVTATIHPATVLKISVSVREVFSGQPAFPALVELTLPRPRLLG